MLVLRCNICFLASNWTKILEKQVTDCFSTLLSCTYFYGTPFILHEVVFFNKIFLTHQKKKKKKKKKKKEEIDCFTKTIKITNGHLHQKD